MKLINLSNWEEFDPTLKSLADGLSETSSPLIFRGQSNSAWRLETTLERAGENGMPVNSYFRLVTGAVLPAVETFTGNNWGLSEVGFAKCDIHSFGSEEWMKIYPYLVYLRHHGFPSPLLDWSHSPYIAAFFASGNLFRLLRKGQYMPFAKRPTAVRAVGLKA